jgi:response regulator RpfG family c-di-GMP phosphodiesterase
MTDYAVLFVDDEQNILNSLERLFHDDELKILKAISGEDALELVKNEEISVLVSDNCMPGMKGVELLSKVRDISPDVVRILMTAYADLPIAMDAINRGEVFRFIEKPWDNTLLKETVTVYEGISRFQIIKALKSQDESSMLSLAQTIELKDKYTRGHCDRVARYALMIADALSLSEETKKEITYGSWLHDCGKIGIPDAILNKPAELDEEEFKLIKKHPALGVDVAEKAHLSDVIRNIILHHHERYDGTGYPSGIKGKDIPLEARIVAIADCFDAVTSDRAYRKAYSMEEGIYLILSLKNSCYDEELVDIFISCIKNLCQDECAMALEMN